MSRLWINGTLTDKHDAGISPFDHGLLHGDGVWEHFRLVDGELVRPEFGFNHLANSAAALGLDIPLSPEEWRTAIAETARANQRAAGYVRVIVTRGPGTLGPDPRKIVAQVIIIVEEYRPFPRELQGHGLHVATAPVRIDTANPALRVRSLGRPHVMLAKQHALRHGCLDAILLTTAGHLAGTTEGTLFLIRDGQARTHPGCPPDSAASIAEELLHQSGIAVHAADLMLDDLRTADEVFLAGTACGIIGIIRLDGVDLGTGCEGAVTKSIRQANPLFAGGSE